MKSEKHEKKIESVEPLFLEKKRKEETILTVIFRVNNRGQFLVNDKSQQVSLTFPEFNLYF